MHLFLLNFDLHLFKSSVENTVKVKQHLSKSNNFSHLKEYLLNKQVEFV